jgi:hypothetical protein
LGLAGSLAGCSGYSVFEPDMNSAFTTGKQTAWSKPDSTGSTGATSSANVAASTASSDNSDRADSAAMSSLFARASTEDKTYAVAPAPVPTVKPALYTKPVAYADADPTMPITPPTVTSPPPTAQKVTTDPRGRAYLFRGIAGLIYSRGVDKLGDRIKRIGLPADTNTYLVWRQIAEQVIADYRRDPQPVILIGHSMGGDAALSIAERLNGEGIPVSLLVTYDPSRIADDVPPNVERYINVFQSSNMMGGGNVVQGARFHGHYASFNLKEHTEIIHVNIEKADRIQEQIVTKIKDLVSTPATEQGEAVPIHLQVPSDVNVELWDSGVPVSAHAGDTLKSIAVAYKVPLWSVNQINSSLTDQTLIEGQRVVVPRHLVPMAATAVSYAAPR